MEKLNPKLRYALLAFDLVGLAMIVTSIVMRVTGGTNSSVMVQLLLYVGLIIVLLALAAMFAAVSWNRRNRRRR
ncbi:hypothetical protein [Nonomuraea aurantiaca]|uniref:hypothetical protein n=1 Tax=Nonomuraea aurantiaca TaxID=2878562 RepID=UPI001CD9A41A|nr:hypothetical protein [Nonomuraea aurantiaca]MCA2223092.1 hypothetical protein [Nonomuraea aurantiaca]